MKLFTENTETLLYEKAKSLSAHPDNWRCLYFNFSDNNEQYAEGLRTYIVTNILKQLLEEQEGYIYLCKDGDIVILFQGKATPILDKLGEHFKEMGRKNVTTLLPDSLYSLLDLSKHWHIFFNLCKTKVAHTQYTDAPKPIPQPTPTKDPALEVDTHLFHIAAAKRSTRKSLQVLVVEDDPFTRKLVTTALRPEYEVIGAATASEALKAYGHNAPDAVFLDIDLPDSNGHIVLSKILACDPAAFVVMLSAHSVKENILAALEKGAQGFVTKPFAKEKLLHYLRLCETVRNAIYQGATIQG